MTNRSRDLEQADATGLGDPFHARGDVDAVTEDVVAMRSSRQPRPARGPIITTKGSLS
jgi:hypothetical protein